MRGGGCGGGGGGRVGGGGRIGWPVVSKGYGMKHLLGSGSHIFHNLPGLSNNRCGKTGVREERRDDTGFVTIDQTAVWLVQWWSGGQ